MRLLEEILKTPPEIFVKNMLVPWIEENVYVFAQLSRIDVWTNKTRKSTTFILEERTINYSELY